MSDQGYFSFNKADPTYDEIVDFVKGRQLGSCLDVGSSNGFLMERLEPCCRVTGIDTDPKQVEMTCRRGLNTHVGSVLDLPFAEDSFDLVVAKDVIEHVQDNFGAVRELVRVTRRYVFISAPAPFTNAAWGDFTHYRPYTKTTLEHIADIFGLQVVRLSAVSRPWPYRALAWLWRQPIADIAVYAFYRKQ